MLVSARTQLCSNSARKPLTVPGVQWRGAVGAARARRCGLRRAVVEDVETGAGDAVAPQLPRHEAAEQWPNEGQMAEYRTKTICTIGPATSSPDMLRALALNGMDVARLNMTHGDHAWHGQVIHDIQKLNEEGFNIAVMVDTEGSEVHLKALDPITVQTGQELVFSVRPPLPGASSNHHFQVSYDAFVDDVCVGDKIMVDGGMVIVEVTDLAGPDVMTRVAEPGKMMSRASLTLRRRKELVRGKSTMLPVITSKDWIDIDFALRNKVDFLAISFVRDHNVIKNVKSYVEAQLANLHPGHRMEVVAKMEAYESVTAMPDIIAASDCIMVARSDLGAQIPMEDVPAVQKEIVFRCRQMGKPVFVASQLLSSMIDIPVPTRAEVADCADAVRQQADALMLSAETAAGQYPIKAVQVLRKVYSQVEEWVAHEKSGSMMYPHLGSTPEASNAEELCTAAATLASRLKAKAIIVYTRSGQTAGMVSRRRPDCPVLAITNSVTVLRRLNVRWGVTPVLMPLAPSPEDNIQDALRKVSSNGMLETGDLVVVVSDVVVSTDVVRSIQLRHVL